MESLKGLVDIDASGCKISDLTLLASLTQLKYLKIRYNLIEDVTPISNLTQFIELNLSYNQIIDVYPLAKLSVYISVFIFKHIIFLIYVGIYTRVPMTQNLY